MTHAAIPDAYLGVWRRRLLRTSAGDDTTTLVRWLQTPVWHADIRIPATRPALSGARSLADLDRAGLLALAAQQGFAGVTTVQGDICRWHRRVDIQPPSGFSDVGRIVFENGERMLEHGVEQDYFEIWERVPASTGPWAALACTTDEGDVWLMRTGDHAIRVRPRAVTLAPADSLAALAAEADDATLRTWLDFDLRYAEREADGTWRVRHATLPWFEGTALFESEVLEAAVDGSTALAARHWHPLG
jgi:hypothetical protein